MGIELPGELAEVTAAAAVSWLHADEDLMRAQAAAWRVAADRLTTLAAEADASAEDALAVIPGTAGDGVRELWSEFADPETGQLNAAARDAGMAADRLEHAAAEITAAKAEMLRQLRDAAKNRDAVLAAGDPAAPAGLDMGLRSTAVNLAAIIDELADSVGAAVAGPMPVLARTVDPNPAMRPMTGFAGSARARPVSLAPQEVQPRPAAPPPVSPVPATAAVPVPGVPPRPGAPRQERESVVALFLVHMFPIGHLPIATDRPAGQLPVPSPEFACAAGLRFAPYDHPASDLIDDGAAVTKVLAGFRRAPTPAAGAAPVVLSEGYDPLGGLHERDWVRRFFAGMRRSAPEFAWPPGELHPEGGREAGEAVVLPGDTLLDRLGSENGRIFAPDATPFARRSLPPAQLSGGYRRYRVLRDLPMWRALSASWFAQPGGGVRYRAIHSADELVTLGYLADITGEGDL